jgi:hypothetical protein
MDFEKYLSVGQQIFAKGRLFDRRFVPLDVLFRQTFGCRTFCLSGRFVPQDVFSRRTFCPTGRFI